MWYIKESSRVQQTQSCILKFVKKRLKKIYDDHAASSSLWRRAAIMMRNNHSGKF
jgi:hypothetical protein